MRVLKIIFFFLFLSPGQTESSANVQEKDGSNDQNKLMQASPATLAEVIQINKLNSRFKFRASYSKKQFKLYGLNLGTDFSFDSQLVLNETVRSINEQDFVLISDQLLKHCYRSKSKSLDKEPASLV